MPKTDTSIVPTLNESQLAVINGTTPREFIKQRPGRGGKLLDYVEVGYVIKTLNEAFNRAWDWDIVEQQISNRQVWVKGKLTVWLSPDFKLTKTAFGGTEIKMGRDGNSIDIGDDLKAAAADALKKAASMLGIAADIYFPQLDRIGGESINEEPQWIKDGFNNTEMTSTPTPHAISPKQADLLTNSAKETMTLKCVKCGQVISAKEFEYSTSRFGQALCFNDQPGRNQ